MLSPAKLDKVYDDWVKNETEFRRVVRKLRDVKSGMFTWSECLRSDFVQMFGDISQPQPAKNKKGETDHGSNANTKRQPRSSKRNLAREHSFVHSVSISLDHFLSIITNF